jgi:hypothetical protein
VLVLQLRDAGRLDLDDEVGRHLPVPKHGDATIRRLLSHTSGVQREPYGNIWDTLIAPDARQFLDELAKAEQVLPPSRRWHYSNLAYALLGHVVAQLHGASWEEVLADRLLGPLGLKRTTIEPTPPVATGYLVQPYSDHARPETQMDAKGLAAAGQLWSTPGDLARWMAFLAEPDPDIVAPGTVEEMCTPVTVPDDADLSRAWGLGLELVRRGDRVVHAGHGGAMPGFIAGAYFRRGERAAAAVCGSSGAAEETGELAHDLLDLSLDLDPLDIEPWRPGPPAPAEYASLLGRWWAEGVEFVFSWRDGHLEARAADAPADKPPAVFGPDGTDVMRVVSGRETGELLRLTRDDDGTVAWMHWATYRITRDQQTVDDDHR